MSVTNEIAGNIGGAVQARDIHGDVNLTVYTGAAPQGELTPQFKITCQPQGDDGMFLWLTLIGPSTLDRVDEVVVRVLDDMVRPPSAIAGSVTAEQMDAVVWGPWRFPPGLDHIDQYGRTAVMPTRLEMGDQTRVYMERTTPPRWWESGTPAWRRQYAGTPLRLLFTCRRDGVDWRIPVDVMVEVDEQQATAIPTDAQLRALQVAELRAAAAERERLAIERHRAQASKITIRLDREPHTVEPSTTRYRVSINNASPSPVYGLRLRWYQGTAPWQYNGTDVNELEHLMPGVDEMRERVFEGGSLVSLGAVLEFTDSAGVRWRRRLNGELVELTE